MSGRAGRAPAPLHFLLAIRGSIGLANLLAPQLVARMLGFRSPDARELHYVMRIWAARNLALTGGTWRAAGDARRTWLAANVAVDLLDVASGARFHAGSQRGAFSRALSALPPVAAAALGAAAARRPGGPAGDRPRQGG